MEPTQDIDIDLWPASRWQQDDLDTLVQTLQPFGTVAGRRSSDSRGLDLITVIAFAGGAVAAGFFNEIGSNLVDLAGKLAKLLCQRLKSKFREGNKERVFETHGRLSLYYTEANTRLECSFVCRYSAERHLEAFFKGLLKAQSIVNASIAERRAPFDREGRFRVVTLVDFTESAQPDWSLQVERVTPIPNVLLPEREHFSAVINHQGKFIPPVFSRRG